MTTPDPGELELLAELATLQATLERTAREAQGIGASVAPLRSALDGLGDQVRQLDARSRDVAAGGRHAREALDRIRLIALNLALEGARVGDTLGQAILAIADEVRVAASRGVEAAREQADALERLDAERKRLGEQLDMARRRGESVAEELLKVQAAARDAEAAAARVARRIGTTASVDPETAQTLLAASEQAQALASTLARLDDAAHDALPPALDAALASLGPWIRRAGAGEPGG